MHLCSLLLNINAYSNSFGTPKQSNRDEAELTKAKLSKGQCQKSKVILFEFFWNPANHLKGLVTFVPVLVFFIGIASRALRG